MKFCAFTSLRLCVSAVIAFVLLAAASAADSNRLERIRYNNPGLVVDLGVGLWAWPMPMDWDRDGDLDLVVACPDKPYNGVYFFENPAGKGVKFPTFKAGKRLGPAAPDMTLSFANGQPRIMAGRNELIKFRNGDWSTRKSWFPQVTVVPIKHPRDHFWRWADYDGDGRHDLIVGHGDWSDFGWFDKNEWWKGYNSKGEWTGAPLHGPVFWLRNEGTDATPKFAAPNPILADGKPIDVAGRPGQMLADFDGDGDFDLMCGEFLDGFTYFQNIGTRTAPKYAAGQRLGSGSKPLALDLEMIVPHAIDWDGDGDIDMIAGDEDGRVAFVENSGRIVDGMPQFMSPHYFQQEADEVKFGALATPFGVDWDGDGDIDLIAGNTAGYVGFIENLSGPGVERPKCAAPKLLQAKGETIRIMAGANGSIQGPIEAKWGYTTLSVADWDGDGLPDIIANSIWSKVIWYRNTGTRKEPNLAAAQPIEVEWPGDAPKPKWNWWNPHGKELVTQWRTTPFAVDWNGDGLTDLVMMDHEGYLALYQRARRGGQIILQPPQRVFADEGGELLRLNAGEGGKSGRRKLCVVDWGGDGKLDLLVNSKNANFLRQIGSRDGKSLFKDEGQLASENIEGHDVSPATVDWNGDGVPDFIGGGEDGHFYYLKNTLPRKRAEAPRVQMQTDFGVIELQLDAERAPMTTANFLRYIDDGFYDGGIFHRTVTIANQPANKVKIEVIQGAANPAKTNRLFAPIRLERTRDTGLKHLDATISMARDGADTAQDEFFICIGNQPELDFGGKRNPDGQGFAAFGKVVKGMDVVRKIQTGPADAQKLTPPIRIQRMFRVK